MIMILSTLGDFSRYSPVFYRVFVEGEGSRSRIPIVIATNVGPLALLAAHIIDLRERYNGAGHSFFLGFVTPITLSTVIAKDVDDFRNLVTNPRVFLCRVSKDLVESIRFRYQQVIDFWQKYDDVERLCREKHCERIHYAVNLEIEGCDSSKELEPIAYHIATEQLNKELNNSLELSSTSTMIVRKVKLEIIDLCSLIGRTSREKIEVPGYLGLFIVPQTGRYIGKNFVGLFREKSGDDVEVFVNVMRASYVRALRLATAFVCNKILNHGFDSVRVLIDTTHGLNIATSMLTQIVRDSLPLMGFELRKALANRSSKYSIRVYLYSSDPALGLHDKEFQSLKITVENNISYYFALEDVESVGTIGDVLRRVSSSILKTLRNYRGDHELKIFERYLEALCMLNKGLVVWGLYTLDTLQEEPRYVPTWLKITVKSAKENEMQVQLSIHSDKAGDLRALARVADKIEIGLWLTSLAKDVLREVSRMLRIEGVNCWSGVVDDKNVVCYDLDKLKKLVTALNSEHHDEEVSISKVSIDFMRELIEDLAKIILENEVKEWIENASKRIQYFVPPLFHIEEKKVSEARPCSEILGEKKENHFYYLTPMKVQSNPRNVLAHAGLTAVHRFVAIAFTDTDDGKCRARAFCIAAPLPTGMIIID